MDFAVNIDPAKNWPSTDSSNQESSFMGYLFNTQLANASGFSLHAGVFANADEPKKLERLCRYISRPAISEQRLSMTDHGKVRYELKTPYRDGTTHVFFNPIDFIGKLAALVPPPRLDLTRFYGIFAPNSNLRAQVTASQRGKNSTGRMRHMRSTMNSS